MFIELAIEFFGLTLIESYEETTIWCGITSQIECCFVQRQTRLTFLSLILFGSENHLGLAEGIGLVELIKEPVQREIVEREVRDIVSGLCTVLNSRRWVNHPNDMSQARLKPYQLKLARSMGFCVPDSIITNDPEEAKLFCQAPTVFKMLAKQSFEYGDKFYSVDTTLMTDELIANLSFIRSQPILLQRCVEKIAELRVTYVGGEVFVAKQTTSVEGAPVDWRPLQGTQDSMYDPWDTSPGFVAQIQSLMKRLNLKFAAVDFAVDSDGVLWFLEVNPNGQWLGYTDEIGMPAAASMARLLAP